MSRIDWCKVHDDETILHFIQIVFSKNIRSHFNLLIPRRKLTKHFEAKWNSFQISFSFFILQSTYKFNWWTNIILYLYTKMNIIFPLIFLCRERYVKFVMFILLLMLAAHVIILTTFLHSHTDDISNIFNQWTMLCVNGSHITKKKKNFRIIVWSGRWMSIWIECNCVRLSK